MSALAKEVKSLDEDNWMFEGPRSRINHISKPGTLKIQPAFIVLPDRFSATDYGDIIQILVPLHSNLTF